MILYTLHFRKRGATRYPLTKRDLDELISCGSTNWFLDPPFKQVQEMERTADSSDKEWEVSIVQAEFTEIFPSIGTAHVRDPDSPCTAFIPGDPDPYNRCEGDGHYLCKECALYRSDDDEAKETDS
jgi:hypothetical protein